MIKLSSRTLKLIKIFYEFEEEQEEVISVLENQCADNLPFCENGTPLSMERIRFSVLRLDKEHGEFNQWVKLANIDWRDLFIAAGFGDTDAHLDWANKLIEQRT